ncbi:unnamed protein product [Trypanosoma congolense IL3000]|uniref:WGS project CAEQ00000000 data, annotated contig 949 n=1 Tax=Trypanosoma congolense (strain IL3000) TaxID=1068625 RepID=F9WJT9_TRYCI|nr:unnamed protein product [Trypanosoma congolense IL3000]
MSNFQESEHGASDMLVRWSGSSQVVSNRITDNGISSCSDGPEGEEFEAKRHIPSSIVLPCEALCMERNLMWAAEVSSSDLTEQVAPSRSVSPASQNVRENSVGATTSRKKGAASNEECYCSTQRDALSIYCENVQEQTLGSETMSLCTERGRERDTLTQPFYVIPAAEGNPDTDSVFYPPTSTYLEPLPVHDTRPRTGLRRHFDPEMYNGMLRDAHENALSLIVQRYGAYLE